jgi:hypothetical protein
MNTIFFKNDREEYFKLQVFKKESLDGFFDELNLLGEKLTWLNVEPEFDDPIDIEVADRNNVDVIGILTHEASLLDETKVTSSL